MNFILYIKPLIVVVVVLLFGHTDKFNKKSLLQAVGVLLAAIVLSVALYYLSKLMINNVKDAVLLIAIAILMDVILQSVIIFGESVLFRKIFGLNEKMHFWTYAVLMVCVVISSILYYVDYGNMFSALANGFGNGSLLDMFMYVPKFENLRRVLAIVPAIAVVVDGVVKLEKN